MDTWTPRGSNHRRRRGRLTIKKNSTDEKNFVYRMAVDNLESYKSGLASELTLSDPHGVNLRAAIQSSHQVRIGDNQTLESANMQQEPYQTLESPNMQQEPYRTLSAFKSSPASEVDLHKSIPGFLASDVEDFTAKGRNSFSSLNVKEDLLRLRNDFCRLVGLPLQEKRFVFQTRYKVARKYPHSEIIASRVEDLRKIGPLVDRFSLRNLGLAGIWLQSLVGSRMKAGDIKYFGQKRKFYGACFYSSYEHGKKGHPRFTGVPGNTVTNIHQRFRAEFLRRFNRETSIELYTFDFSGCPPRIVEHIVDRFDGPLLHQSVTERNFWDALTHDFQKERPRLATIQTKTLRKVIKTSTLALLNGGAAGGLQHFQRFLENDTDCRGTPLMKFAYEIRRGLARLPISEELMRLRETLHVDGESFLMSSPKPHVNRDKSYTNASFVMSSGEMAGLTFLIEFLATTSKPLVPLALEHDGVLVACTESLDDLERSELSDQFTRFFWSATGIHLPIEIKDAYTLEIENQI
jgi:hypothetical protein